MSVHVAITRVVRPGCEAEFQQALREFFQASYGHEGVQGASLLTPLPGSGSREYGILRTFRSEQERQAFYASPLFEAWERQAQQWTEGEPIYRELHGLEAWFQAPHPTPPRWKMAIATFLGVFPTSLLLTHTVGPQAARLPFPLGTVVFALLMVALLTWVVMPLVVVPLLHRWLHAPPATSNPPTS